MDSDTVPPPLTVHLLWCRGACQCSRRLLLRYLPARKVSNLDLPPHPDLCSSLKTCRYHFELVPPGFLAQSQVQGLLKDGAHLSDNARMVLGQLGSCEQLRVFHRRLINADFCHRDRLLPHHAQQPTHVLLSPQVPRQEEPGCF